MNTHRSIFRENSFRAAGAWRAELKAFMVLGLPMALTQLVQFSINTIDVLMIGRLGPESLAGSSQGLVIFYAAFLIGIGPAMAVTPMVSQALGADMKDTTDARRSVRMGLWVIALMFPFIALLLSQSESLIKFLGQPTLLAEMASPYVMMLIPGWPFMLGVIVLRNFLAAIEKTRVPLYIIMVTTLVNAFLNYLFIFGNWGFPRMELAGAGIASSLAHFFGFMSLVIYIQRDAIGRRFDLFSRILKPDWERLRQVFQLGWPIGITLAFEALLFNACIFIMGRIGVNEVAAYQVALNVAAMAFMMPLGFSMAGATRVGLAQGAKNQAGVARAAIVTMAVCVGSILVVAIPVALFPHWVAGLYLDKSAPDNLAALSLVATYLPIAAFFAVFDGAQVACAQCLRGLKDVKLPMIITGFSYWIVGFPLAVWLSLSTAVGSIGVWWGLLVSLVLVSALLGVRLWFVIKNQSVA